MASNRIQKLLFSEYSDFEDVVLVESPFAETDEDGNGIRQVQIGLTPSKLILASYSVEPLDELSQPDFLKRSKGQDPDIESFELVSAYPVECVNLSVYRFRRRQTLKARFCNGKVVYYEIGGWHERRMLWSVWCERIKFLSPYETTTSVSETSIASASSSGSSSLYIVRSSLSVSQTGQPTLWCHYASSEANQQSSWGDPHLYLGPAYLEKGVNSSSLSDIDKRAPLRKILKSKPTRCLSKEPLFLSPEHELLSQEALELWESWRIIRRRIHRMYGLNLCPYLLGGLGLWRLSRSQAYSLQTKKSVSLIYLDRDDEEFSLAVPRRQLLRTVSLEKLEAPAPCPDKLYQLANRQTDRRTLDFWIRNRQNKPEWGRKQYKSQQRHLRLLRTIPSTHDSKLRNKRKVKKEYRSHSNQSSRHSMRRKHRGSGDSCATSPADKGDQSDDGVECMLPIDKYSTSSLSHQLVMLDKQLFLNLSSLELARVRRDMSNWNAPHLTALVAFSHRITCVVVAAITSEYDIKKRAKVIIKFIGVAYKCHKLHSQQSAESVLRGLQSPAVYRLTRTWRYVRTHYASKYRRFEDLSKRYMDPRLPLYEKTYENLTRTPPYLPAVSMLTALLLRKISDLSVSASSTFSTECFSNCQTVSKSFDPEDPLPKPLRKFLSAVNIYRPVSSAADTKVTPCHSDTHLHAVPEGTLLEHLDKFFAPVSSSSPARRHLQDVEYFLETNQLAAHRYAIRSNSGVRAFLRYYRHLDMTKLFGVSLSLDP